MKKITLLSFLLISVLTQAQSFTENFNANSSTTSTFSKTISGIVFNFTFTTDGDGGDFSWENTYGEGNSASINALSHGVGNFSTTEKITIKRADGNKFKFTSIYFNNTAGTTISAAGYNNNTLVGSIKNATNGFNGTLTFGDITVNEVRFTSTDFLNSNFDSFIGNLTTNLGIEDIYFTDIKTEISPNPANDYLTISGLKTTENFSIYNVSGLKLLGGTIDDKQKIDIQSLMSGLYFLKLENNVTLKFIKN